MRITIHSSLARAAGLFILTAAFTHPARAQKPNANVVVVNSAPIPVSGTVQAQQSGPWSFNLTGTPAVTITGTPAVTLTGTPAVTLAGTPVVTLAPTSAPLPVSVTLPVQAFTIPPTYLTLTFQGSSLLAPDPSGTRYAITSVVVSNPTSVPLELNVRAVAAGVISGGCLIVANATAVADGPKLTVQPSSTGTLTYPVPFVTAAVTGSPVCLTASGNTASPGTSWSIVGYKILP